MRLDLVLGGRYRLIRRIARGGMAEVWEGNDDILSRRVAVKILLPPMANDRNLLERFRFEAIAAARLTHPGFVAVYDTGSDNGTAYIVMELVRGHSLHRLLAERGPMDPPMAIDVAGQIAEALAHAHGAGLVHRDIKPGNILLVEGDSAPPRAKVADFGIVKATKGIGLDLTQTGMILGTPTYLSPEQVEGQEPDARADLYSLGVVLIEMLTCRVPFEEPTDIATALAHVRQQPPRVSSLRADIPPELDQLVGDLLAKDPTDRIPSAVALRQALARIPLRRADPQGSIGIRARCPVHAPLATPVLVPATTPTLRQPLRGRHIRHRHWLCSLAVFALLVAGAAVADIAVSDNGSLSEETSLSSAHSASETTRGLTTISISGVQLWMNVTDYTRDDPDQAWRIFDGNTRTFWSTGPYTTATFGGHYSGEGLAIHLTGTHTLRSLEVTTPTVGWAAQTYVANSRPAAGSPVSSWGSPTESKFGISGSTAFALKGRSGSWVLFWLTNLGPHLTTQVNEFRVT